MTMWAQTMPLTWLYVTYKGTSRRLMYSGPWLQHEHTNT